MCINLPVKVSLIKDNRIYIQGREKQVSGSLIKIKVGDYVYLQNNFIIQKINKKDAQVVINLVKNG
ncbi:MAG: HypC/HybG/HupF family hydrogenase formation chaperone [Candidatus Nealsonbacteria bacterium]